MAQVRQHGDPEFNFDKPVYLPAESIGACSNAPRCHNGDTVLGNGVCLKCWDNGLATRTSKRQSLAFAREQFTDLTKRIDQCNIQIVGKVINQNS